MLSNYWKPISIVIVFSIIISTHGRPEGRRAQDLKQDRAADSVQMLNWTRYRSGHRDPASTHEPESRIPRPTPTASQSEAAIVPTTSNQSESEVSERKLSQVIVTSNLETVPADVECKSESQPIFFKRAYGGRRLGRTTRVAALRKAVKCQKRAIESPDDQLSTTKVRRNGDYQSAHYIYDSAAPIDSLFYIQPQEYLAQDWNSFQQPYSLHYPLDEKMPESLQNVNVHQAVNEMTTTRSPTTLPTSSTNPKDRSREIILELEKHNNPTKIEAPITTKIVLRPVARARAGAKGVAIASPISTAYVKRGDVVEIEYVPVANAEVGEGGVAITRPELVIHFIDRRRK